MPISDENLSSAEAATRPEPVRLSRRSLLAGSAGLTLASIAAGTSQVLGQEMDHSMMVSDATSARGLGSRIYDINVFEGMSDIAHDPTNIPPPITRTAPDGR